MKYEQIISERMRERQIAGLKKGEEVPFRPNEPNGETTSKRKELAKIANTSEGSIQRTIKKGLCGFVF